MRLETAVALGLAAGSTTLTNLAYVREQAAASSLPPLSLREPLRSLRLLLAERRWLTGFAMESAGFGLYAGAVALASLALVQSVAAGGIGALGYVCARLSGGRLHGRQLAGISLSVLGLLALGISLTHGSTTGTAGSLSGIIAWIAGTAMLAGIVLTIGRRTSSSGVADGIAGGLLFSMGDFSTKVATGGGLRFIFVVTLIVGYGLGTSLIQIGYQRAGALTVAGLATLTTNALPIVAGTVVLHEPVPSGALGAVRVLAFVLVIAGAILIAAPRRPPSEERRAARAATEAAEASAR